MAAPMVDKVHVVYDDDDTGSEADSEGSSNLNDEFDDVDVKEEDDASPGKTGLADVFAKILHNKVPAHKQVILAKGQTDREILKRKLEKEETDEKTQPATKKTPTSGAETARIEKLKIWENLCRSKPDPLNRDKERQLQRIATRGVVQLFNAVRKQQKEISDEIEHVGKSERKKDKVMEGMTKDKFLTILKGASKTNVKSEPIEEKKAKPETASDDDEAADSGNDDTAGAGKQWDILRDDYMMGAKLKDWDRDNSDSDDDGGPGDPDMSDSD